ncbi:MAG TPA: hypothetical protein VFQ43_19100 [Nitrososphaera sp.]|nr:hypothetical protein [Nitrososphaera sp.]
MPVSKSGFRGGYYYLSPWFNFYEQNMYQPDPNEHVDVFYAENYGQPSTDMVVLVTEGESGKAAFDFLLGNLFPRWKVLKLKVLNGRGAGQTVLAAEVIKETGAGYILAPDKDAEPFYARMGEQPDWKATIAAMNNAPKSYLDPDLEGVNPTALVATIKELNPRAKFDESAVMNELGQYVVDVRKWSPTQEDGWYAGLCYRADTKALGGRSFLAQP